MNEFMIKLQGDRKYSFVILGIALALTLAVSVIGVSKLSPQERTFAASSGNLVGGAEVAGPEITGPAAFPEPVPLNVGPAAAAAEGTAETSVALQGKAAGFGIATTTTVPATTTTQTTTPQTTIPGEADAGAATPEPEVGEEDYVDTGNGVLVPPVLLKIRFCESRDSYVAKNPRSTAAGGYQFLTGSWKGYGHAAAYGVSTADQATPAQQDQAALSTWKAAGTTPWNASKYCWTKR